MGNKMKDEKRFLFCRMTSKALEDHRETIGKFLKWYQSRTDISPYDKETIENSLIIGGTAGYTHDLMIKGLLRDFFDEQGIRCFVGYSDNSGAFKPEIRTKTKPSEGDHDWKMDRVGFIQTYSTRQEAEVFVLGKAFEILGDVLKKKKKKK